MAGTLSTYLVMAWSPQFLDIILPLNESRIKKLPYEVYYFINYSDSYFCWIMSHISLTSTLEMFIFIGSESILGVFTEHACGLLKIIK